MRKLAAVLMIGDILLGAVATGLYVEGTYQRVGSILLAVAGSLFLAGTILALATDSGNP